MATLKVTSPVRWVLKSVAAMVVRNVVLDCLESRGCKMTDGAHDTWLCFEPIDRPHDAAIVKAWDASLATRKTAQLSLLGCLDDAAVNLLE